MPCYSPLQANFTVVDGKKKITFSNINAEIFQRGDKILGENHMQLPCGKCMGCRLERSRQWALRCMHEASLHENNCFITLTYDDDHLPKDGSLNKKHFQDFMKRLREKFVPKMPDGLIEFLRREWVMKHGIRYYHCGEYGESLSRPHYHACLFNFDFADKTFWKLHNDEKYYVSQVLEDLWGHGFCVIGDLTFESAAYVARYCTKVINGDMALDHYQGKVPEYATMSRNPGIARGWYEKFTSDVFPSDNVVLLDGVRDAVLMKPPRYYDNIFIESSPEDFEFIKNRRLQRSQRSIKDQTYRRLKDREKCQEARANNLVRQLEFL